MSLETRIRNSFLAGLLLVTPLAVTIFVLQFVFARMTGLLNPIVQTTRLTTYTANVEIIAQLLAAVLLAAAITLLGYLASRGVGQRLFGSFERAIQFVPLVRTIYFGVRQVGESLTERADRYESVVLVEFHRRGAYSIGFVTNESPREARNDVDETLVNVFVPNSPNPTAGALLMLPESDVHDVDISVRRGLRLLVTTGLSTDTVDDEKLPEMVAGATAGDSAPGDT